MHFITFFVSVFAASALLDRAIAACNCDAASIGCLDNCINEARQCMATCSTKDDVDKHDNLGDCINQCLEDNWPGYQFSHSDLEAKVQDTDAILDEDINASEEEQGDIEESTNPEEEIIQEDDSEEQEADVIVKAAVGEEEEASDEDESREQSVEDDQAGQVQSEDDEAQEAKIKENEFQDYVEDESANAEEFGNRKNIFAIIGDNHQEDSNETIEASEDDGEYYDVTQAEASTSGKTQPTQSANDHSVATVTEYTTTTSHLTVMPNGSPAYSSNLSRGSSMPDVNSAVAMEISGAVVTVMALACAYFIV